MNTRIALVLCAFLTAATLLAHGGHKHVMGTVVSIGKTSIVVKTTGANVSVPLTAATKYFHGSSTKHRANRREIAAGSRVLVHLAGDGKAAEVHMP